MKKQLREVREFDRIISEKIAPHGLDGFKTLPDDAFHELENFIIDYTSARDNEDALSFFRITSQRSVGKTIRVNNYVGLIQLKSGQQVQILPKIDFGGKPDKTKEIFLRMLRSVRKLPGKSSGAAHLDAAHMTIYEVFIRMFVQDVWQLLRRGLKSAYLRQEDNLPFYKGKLVFREHIKRNVAHQERFYVAYDEYHQNRAENRLLKSTLLKLQRVTEVAETQREIRRQLGYFEAVEPSDNYHRDFSRIVIDRSTREYEGLLEWSRVFLFDEGFTTFSGAHRARALLFPMEKLFEAYVAKSLKKVVSGSDWDVTAQDRRYHLFDEPEKRFALRPDIVMRRKSDGHTIVLDTKWKRLSPRKDQNYGISQADMYQMYVYSKKYHAPDIWLLYPWTKEMKDFSISFESKDGVTVHVFFVNVADITKSLEELRDRLEVRRSRRQQHDLLGLV